ncbi:unnamed protein product, partial [Mesorhabditis belari]|uniref:Serine protease n=1 Tax=Mesorhabditis belari TaxID=2138241 RepID=A0AAF3F3F4_9BILA
MDGELVAVEHKVSLPEDAITQEAVKKLFSLPLATIVTLRYGDNEKPEWCKLDSTGSRFLLPEGWPTMEFVVDSRTPPQPVIRIKVMDGELVAVEHKVSLPEEAITQEAVKKLFSLPLASIVRLRYGDNEKPEWCNLDSTGSRFLLPYGWPTMEFVVDSCLPPPPPQTRGVSKILNDWENRVFCIQGRGGMLGSCVLLNNKRIFTAAHISFKLGDFYPIKGPGLKGSVDVRVRCVLICNKHDFAVLVSDALEDLPLSTFALQRGSKYFMMGYPTNGVDTSWPTITKGIIEGMMVDDIHLVGTPGSKRGYSGAPVFDDSGRFSGLLIGGAADALDHDKNHELLCLCCPIRYYGPGILKLSMMRCLTSTFVSGAPVITSPPMGRGASPPPPGAG